METTTRIPGTTFDKARGKWKAQLRLDGKLRALGNFATQQEAAAAVVRARAGEVKELTLPDTLSSSELAIVKHNLAKTQVFQSNELVESLLSHPLKQDIYEHNLYMRMLQCLHNRDQVLSPLLIPIRTFIPSLDGDYHQALERAIRNISERHLRLSVDGDALSYVYKPLVSCLGYDNTKRAVVGEFNPQLAHHFIKLKKYFTRGDIEVLMQLQTIYSQRFYWIFKEWSGKYEGREKTVTVEELRELTCGAQKYTTWSDFRRLVLKPSIAELVSHQFKIDYEEIYESRNVVRVAFKVSLEHEAAEQEAEFERVAEKMIEVISAMPTPPPVVEAEPVMQVNHTASTIEPASDFEILLAGLDKRLQIAYTRMVAADGDKITIPVAQKIIKLVIGSEAKQKTLFTARSQVVGVMLENFSKTPGYTRAKHIVNAMKSVGLVV
jgi:plasmid replication initiation protein